MINGLIIKGIGGFYYVKTSDGRVAECRARGKLRRSGTIPMVGDCVMITVVNENPYEGAIESINERKNYLIRPPVANIDRVAVVIAAASPEPDLFLVDKLLVCAESSKIKTLIVINKTDLCDGSDIQEIYTKAGYDVVCVSAKTGDGIDLLKSKVDGNITAFAGNSGVGKSSILKCFGFDLETGGVSKIERGRHTTRHVELLSVENGGYVIDTPGFSLLEIANVKSDELKNHFPEFKKYNEQCRFIGCAHSGAKPKDCAVINAVKNKEISESRFNSYTALYNVLKEIKEYD